MPNRSPRSPGAINARLRGIVEVDETFVGGRPRYRNGEQPEIDANGDEEEVVSLEPGKTRQMVSSVDGIITMLSEYRKNSTYARIRVWRTNNVVKCFLKNEVWLTELTTRNVWKRHVTVYGKVTYSARGVPLSIKDITQVHLREGTTKLSELEGTLPRLTGRMGVEGFVKRLRGGDA